MWNNRNGLGISLNYNMFGVVQCHHRPFRLDFWVCFYLKMVLLTMCPDNGLWRVGLVRHGQRTCLCTFWTGPPQSDDLFVGLWDWSATVRWPVCGLFGTGHPRVDLWVFRRKKYFYELACIIMKCRHYRTSWGLYGGSIRNGWYQLTTGLLSSSFQAEGSQEYYCARWQVGTRWVGVIILQVHGWRAVGEVWLQRRSTNASAQTGTGRTRTRQKTLCIIIYIIKHGHL